MWGDKNVFVNTWVSRVLYLCLSLLLNLNKPENTYRLRAIDLKRIRLENNSDSVGFRVQRNYSGISEENFSDKRASEFSS